MLIEIYKGVKISHDAAKDEFYTDIVINKRFNGKNEYIRAPRLQKTRDEVDKYLNTASKKPTVKKGWLKGRRGEFFEPIDIIAYNVISGAAVIRHKDGKIDDVKMSGYYSEDLPFIACKENDAIVANLNKKLAEIDKIQKEISCSRGKLIPLKAEHFI